MKPDPRTGKPLTQNVLGIDNLGNRQMMTPGNDYTFPGNVVTEYTKVSVRWKSPMVSGRRDV
jgi:hypothetical protein